MYQTEKLSNKDFITELRILINSQDEASIRLLMEETHFADIAEIMEELTTQEAIYLFDALDPDQSSEVLLELDEDLREKILHHLTPKEIAEELDELSSDDAADIISELPFAKKQEVINEIEDAEFAKDIVDLLRYDEDTAGGLMAKELIKVNQNLTVFACVRELRRQAQNVDKVHAIYVVDDQDKLLGRLALSDLLTTSLRTPIKDLYLGDMQYVHVDTEDIEVGHMMQKYDLEAVPVVDDLGRLVGRITIDDIVDVIREEADKDYQLAAGITGDVEADDGLLEMTKARLPWLVTALIGGFIAVSISRTYEDAMEQHVKLLFFVPLIVAMAGNVGVQSSAIIVQGIANGTLSDNTWGRLLKELSLSFLNGIILSAILFFGARLVFGDTSLIATTLAISLMAVMMFASLIGTLVPIMLNKFDIDPALATGPFITTSNDILGIIIYFNIARLIIGF